MKSQLLRSVVALALASSLVPAAPQTTRANASTSTNPSQGPGAVEHVSVEELLAAGDYVPGEAIALVRTGDDLGATYATEVLAEVDGDAVKLATDNATKTSTSVDDEAQLRVQSTETDGGTILHVVDPHRSTEQILRDLYDDPDVIAAEPNYLHDTAAFATDPAGTDEGLASQSSGADRSVGPIQPASQDHSVGPVQPAKPYHANDSIQPASQPDDNGGDGPAVADAGADSPTAAGPAAPNPGDLTDQQWHLSESTDRYTTPRSPTAFYNLNVPGWREGRNNPDAPANASGTVCIMDTGIDSSHPDLQGALFTFSEAQQAKYGCGPHGLDVSGADDPRDISDDVSHGTHLAGIVAADWNDVGISGIAHGAKVFGVRITSGNGMGNNRAIIEGFGFLVDVAREVNLKAVNCSWGNGAADFFLTVLVNQLGAQGVNTVFASGNNACDLDEGIETGGQMQSPYAICVNAAQPDGAMTDFSCWGQASTDVFAPGAEILSTIPIAMTTPSSYKDGTLFYPEATAAENLVFGLERFGEATSDVRFYDKNPALDASAQEIGRHTTEVGFDDKGAMAFNVRSLVPSENVLDNYRVPDVGSLYLAIPVESVTDAKWLALRYAANDGNKYAGGIASITCAQEDGGQPVEVDSYWVSKLNKGFTATSNGSVYQSQWNAMSLNVDGYVNAWNEGHAPQPEDLQSTDPLALAEDDAGIGEVSGLYAWEQGGQTYVIAEVGLAKPENDHIGDTSTFYVDSVAVGNGSAFTGSYRPMAGTSMAAPCVTGCLAVIAQGEPENSTLGPDELELEARERAAKLLAAVDYDDNLSELCRTGGRVNLHEQEAFDKKAPFVAAAVCEDGVLTVSGSFFGTSGTLYVDDAKVEALGWQDDLLVASVGALANGPHVAKVVNEDGAVSRAVFSRSSDAATGRLLYERTHSLPQALPEYASHESARLCGPMVSCGDKLFALASSAHADIISGLWSYDTSTDSWASVELPEDYAPQLVTDGSLAATKGKVYMVGVGLPEGVDGNSDEDAEQVPALWEYDVAAATWRRVPVDGLTFAGSICALGDRLFLIDWVEYLASEDADGTGSQALDAQADVAGDEGTASDEGGDGAAGDGAGDEGTAGDEGGAWETTFFQLIDVENGTLTLVKGDIPGLEFSAEGQPLFDTWNDRAVASDNKLYYHLPNFDRSAPGTLVRATYDPQAQAMAIENVTDALKEALGEDMDSYIHRTASGLMNDHFALAGLPDGLAIVGSSELGTDTHILRDTATTPEAYERTSSYHHAFYPLAVCADGYLYAAANSEVEPNVMYFRSTNYSHVDDDPEPQPSTPTTPVTPATPTTPVTPTPGSGANAGTASATKASAAPTTSSTTKASSTPRTGDSLPALGCAAAALAATGVAIALLSRRLRVNRR